MPYCTKCGTQVGDTARFCANCGAPQIPGQAPRQSTASAGQQAGGAQGAPPRYPTPEQVFGGTSPRTARILCYIPWFGWIAAIIVLASDKYKANTPENHQTRFHAYQGLYLFVAWLIVDWVISPALRFGRFGPFPGPGAGILNLLILAAWIFMLVKTSKNENFRLPLIGELAERSVNEQRIL